MSRMMEQLESRVLFIAFEGVILADLDAVKAQGTLDKADLKSALAIAVTDVKGLKTTLAKSSPTSADKAAFATLVKDEAAGATKYKLRITNILNSGFNDGDHLFSVLKQLKAHPNSVAIAAKVQASFNALQGVFSNTVLSSVETQAATTVSGIDSDANTLATDVPATQAGVGTLESHLASDLTTLSTQGTAIQTAIATLGVALS
jgi:hypothetical protein